MIQHKFRGYITRDYNGWLRIHNTKPVWVEHYQHWYSDGSYIPNYMLPPDHFCKVDFSSPKQIELTFNLVEEDNDNK